MHRPTLTLLALGAAVAVAAPPMSPRAAVVPQLLSTRAVSPDNTCGVKGVGGSANAYTCPEDLACCSINGFCGSTTAYCMASAGCQAEYGSCGTTGNDTTSPDMTCGGANGYTCPTGLCCSSVGFCGNTTDYCGSGCQSLFGTCGGGAPGSGNPGGGGGTSTDGMCGPANGFTTCASTECCSSGGFCGTTPDHCRAPDCLFQYGPACDANKIPTGLNTSAVTRGQPSFVEYGGEGIYSCANAGDIALTFDDGPFIYTGDVLDLLKKYNAKASFMVTGINNNKGEIDDATLPWADLIRRMYNEGHQIASHSFSHADLSNITADQRRNEMYKNEMAIRNIIGVFPTYMRPPFSSCSVESGCQADMAALGYHVINFDVDTEDYLHDDPTLIQTSKDIFSTALSGKSPSTDDFLVIGHDIHEQTAHNLTEFMLQTLINAGFNPVTVGDCLGDSPENWYRTDTRTTLGQN